MENRTKNKHKKQDQDHKSLKPFKVAHHFDSKEHQYSSAKQGLWLFMATEILMFGAIFAAYAIYRNLYPLAFAQGSDLLNWKLGFVNTLVLIFSSFTMALAIYYCQTNRHKASVINLFITLACACVFLIIKYFEYSGKISHGILPGKFFHFHEQSYASHLPLFFSFYFVMTGLHGLHVVVGMALITWMLYKVKRKELHREYYTPLEGVGIFWHIVDLIWIYLFPILYLIG